MEQVLEHSFEYCTDNFKFYSEIDAKGGDNHYVEGYITTDDIDLVNDKVTKACQKSILNQVLNQSIKIDVDHETIREGNLNKIPIGRIVDAKLDTKGVWVRVLMNKFSERFEKVWGNIKEGMLDAFSITFKPIAKASQFIKGKMVRLLEDVKLINVALTGNPVNEYARMTDVVGKSLDYLEAKSVYDESHSKLNLENNTMAEEQEIVSQDVEATSEVVEESVEAVEETVEEKSVVEEEKVEEPVEAVEVETEEAEAKACKKAESEDEDEEETEKVEAKSEDDEEAEPEVDVKSLAASIKSLTAEVEKLRVENAELKSVLEKPEIKGLADAQPQETITKSISPLQLIR